MHHKPAAKATPSSHEDQIDQYSYDAQSLPVEIRVVRKPGEFVPLYIVTLPSISKTTDLLLERIRKELVTEVNLGSIDLADIKRTWLIEQRFSDTILDLVHKYFPDLDDKTINILATYLSQKALGLGHIEILLRDQNLEEIAVNGSHEPVWVYHVKHGWLKTNILLENEDQIRHYAETIGRKVGRQINVLTPLMDASLTSGDRINATLSPVSSHGHTITLRKFAAEPWSMTRMMEHKTISPSSAALIWLGIQYELSALICGGTATGKTSFLNAIAEFFPPNQRIVSIEDTPELRLPKYLHWVPTITRLPNTEGRGEITMLDLLVNSLRMRPDRILVGEIRRQREAEVLFEAIHTGHSVYATFHANTSEEAVERLTNPPIDIPKSMLPALSMLIVQYRNRRTGMRRTFEIAEIGKDAKANVLEKLDIQRGVLESANKSKTLTQTISIFTGLTTHEITKDIEEKSQILTWLVKQNMQSVDDVGRAMAEYYTNYDQLIKAVRTNKPLS